MFPVASLKPCCDSTPVRRDVSTVHLVLFLSSFLCYCRCRLRQELSYCSSYVLDDDNSGNKKEKVVYLR